MMHLVVFLGCAVLDALWVAFMHYADRGAGVRAALASMAIAGVGLVGNRITLWNLDYAPAYVAGFGFGTFAAIWIKDWARRRRDARVKAQWDLGGYDA